MTNEEKMAILKLIFNTLFQSKQQGTDITQVMITTNMGNFLGRWFSDNTLRGFDVDINLGNRTIQIRCVEQNPNKMDAKGNLKWTANLARQGHKIMWVIDRNGGFLGRMQDEEWVPGFEPATQPANYQQQNLPQPDVPEIPGQPSYGQDLANSIVPEDLPEIPNAVDIPEYILESIAEMEEPPGWEGDY
jgi:hypothetical protein